MGENTNHLNKPHVFLNRTVEEKRTFNLQGNISNRNDGTGNSKV